LEAWKRTGFELISIQTGRRTCESNYNNNPVCLVLFHSNQLFAPRIECFVHWKAASIMHEIDNTKPDPAVPGMTTRTNACMRIRDTARCLLLFVNAVETIRSSPAWCMCSSRMLKSTASMVHSLMACDVIGSGCVICTEHEHGSCQMWKCCLELGVCLRPFSLSLTTQRPLPFFVHTTHTIAPTPLHSSPHP
jgi:hypothetical protein